MQKYPRGSRGSPAKGVVPVTVARVRISPSAPKTGQGFFLALFLFCGRRTARNRVFPQGRARRRQRERPLPFPMSFADDALPHDRPPPRFARRTLRSRPRPDLFSDPHAARALFPFGTALRLHGVAVLATGVFRYGIMHRRVSSPYTSFPVKGVSDT